MQYVRNLSDSVSTAWNSINPATLSGAIDVIVVEQEDGTLLCSPFHVRFGKFSLLRPYEKKVEFKVNGVKQDYSMKLGEGGEAFFVFETTDNIPKSMQTSPIASPASSPSFNPQQNALQDPEAFELDADATAKPRAGSLVRPSPSVLPPGATARENGMLTPLSTSPQLSTKQLQSGDWSNYDQRHHSDTVLAQRTRRQSSNLDVDDMSLEPASPAELSDRSQSPPPLGPREALERALALSRELSAVNIRTKVTETGDLMLEMSGANEDDAFRAEILARKVLSQELAGNYDVGALIGMDEQGNLWIYSSEEAKDAAMKKTMEATYRHAHRNISLDAVSDPGYQSDDSSGTASQIPMHRRTESDVGQLPLQTPPSSPGSTSVGDPNRNYAKTLRLTSDQLKAMNLKPGENQLSFTVNRATCSANMYLWKHETPVVISDIDGTITKSDALGHVLNMIGRDWTHAGVAKLYNDIANNGYNIMYLTSRSVGQADTTRAYLHGIVQDGLKLPRGPTILLYGADHHAFYAGFGNRLTDQISYRTVDVPRTRIFTINSNAEVSLDLLSLNKLKLSYLSMSEIVEHYFPPVSTLVTGGGEEFTDFTFWRDTPLDLDEFSASDSEEAKDGEDAEEGSQYAEDEDEEVDEALGDSYISRGSGEYAEMEESIYYDDEDADDEEEGAELEHDGGDDDDHEGNTTVGADDAVPTNDADALTSPAVENDADAEVITGVKNLKVTKDAKP
ncbi:nuclear elongation and deformation protein 1 [Magnaporthiopsis poae ATCC 64411]|uniref:Nuclear elongation and deformation protein 1 n=1 Tax=Magnaporthiopsis poae (strain ATCC 64411 / 73-15) TaxID=644358 RepID=A0A0C4E3L1_MAGP6|nr:nuclear elongation and deformation protein 1 [Magnaporthiopsis poae ATCC 64411]